MTRWQIKDDNSILWQVSEDKQLPHSDHVEMSGEKVSVIVHYGANEARRPFISLNVVWPCLRTIPNNTHASCQNIYERAIFPVVVNDRSEEETLDEVAFDGILSLRSHTEHLSIERRVFPDFFKGVCYMMENCTNRSREPLTLRSEEATRQETRRGVQGIIIIKVTPSDAAAARLVSGETIKHVTAYHAHMIYDAPDVGDADTALRDRMEFLGRISESLQLNTEDDVLNRAFSMAKIRAAESVFRTEGGLMHCPGGGSYYAAIWANDQAEYAGPFFPFLGDRRAIEASKNCYRLFSHYMGPDLTAIPSSIIAEGRDIWEGAGDRGDAAMIGYGAARFSLLLGDESFAREIYPAIRWCLAYCLKKRTPEGVIASDSDELEGRFPAGDANLSTSCLALGAFRFSSLLARALGYEDEAAEYSRQCVALKEAIENYFGAVVSGFETYCYYRGCDKLRSWICLPLVMGIENRRKGTVDALFSSALWTENGLATEQGDQTYWDRSTLYGFRGVFLCGETDRAMPYYRHYLTARLLGEHVPYAVEAWPEGKQRHLSAESVLLCLTVLEGLLGLQPEGLHSFSLGPSLPSAWRTLSLNNLHICGKTVSLSLKRTSPEQWHVEIVCACGASITGFTGPGMRMLVNL